MFSPFSASHWGAFTCVVVIGNAGSSKIEDQLQSLGDNFVWIEASSRARNGIRAGARGSRTLVLDDAHAIVEQVPLIKSMSPNVDGDVQMVGHTSSPFRLRRGCGSFWSPELDRYYVAAPMTGKEQAAILVYAPED